jgi:hypothetical protein
MAIIRGDWTDDDWLLLLEDEGHNGLGRVLGYLVFDSKEEAEAFPRGELCDAVGMYIGMEIPPNVTTEVIAQWDFRESYGNRMPLRNRGYR